MPVTDMDLAYYLDSAGKIKPMDHYQALKLTKDFFEPAQFSEAALKEKTRPLWLQYHPDKNTGHGKYTQVEEVFKRIQAAIEVLRDPEQRCAYLNGEGTPAFAGTETTRTYEKPAALGQ